MRRLDEILRVREAVALRYADALRPIAEVKIPPVRMEQGRLSWFVFVVRLADRFTREDRDGVWRRLTENGIGCGRYFPPMHLQPLFAPYAPAFADLAITEHVADRTLALPFFNRLTEAQIAEVVSHLSVAIQEVADPGRVDAGRNT